ncbi:MAG: aldolase/citrate lyase family protein [Deltaproteobacteria bacterium]|nr:aldolase/citrate lyase family protein [Deltaproteobacteria bacterium]
MFSSTFTTSWRRNTANSTPTLTVPATNWKYVEGASRSKANLVMLDLEDSIPRGNDELLQQGRENIIKGYRDLDWGDIIKYFRPRGLALDPDFEDIAVIVTAAGEYIDGLIYPKIESAEEVRSIDRALTELEKSAGLPAGKITFQVLIESVNAEEHVFDIAKASPRLTALIFGAFDYWGSLGFLPHLYSADHPIINDVRCRVVKAAASVGIPAIAEMTLNYPTRDKTDEQKKSGIGRVPSRRRDRLPLRLRRQVDRHSRANGYRHRCLRDLGGADPAGDQGDAPVSAGRGRGQGRRHDRRQNGGTAPPTASIARCSSRRLNAGRWKNRPCANSASCVRRVAWF